MDDTNTLTTNVAKLLFKDGILYAFTENPSPTLADYTAHLAQIKAKFGHLLPLPIIVKNPEKVKVLAKEVREFSVGKEVAEVTVAMAIIQTSVMIRLAANLFFKITTPSYPMQMFSDEAKAVEWLRSFLK
jgi:hypothetical protein